MTIQNKETMHTIITKNRSFIKAIFPFAAILFLISILNPFMTIAQDGGGVGIPVERPLRPFEFLGMDYGKIGYTLNPGEELHLLFRNNQEQNLTVPVSWILSTYTHDELTTGKQTLSLAPGETGKLNIDLPPDMEDGPYMVFFSPETQGWQKNAPFYFDYRKPHEDKELNINLVSFIENMDSEGWVRMMMGSLAPYAHITQNWPEDMMKADAVIVIAEAIDFFNPAYRKLQEYVRKGGLMLCFGQPAPLLAEMLPVTAPGSRYIPESLQEIGQPVSLITEGGGLWQSFNPATGPLHYGLKVEAKPNATVLAKWSDGTPAVVSGKFGHGTVIYIGTGSGQVWQNLPTLEGADELALRLLYHAKGGDASVSTMLKRAEQIYEKGIREETAIRDKVFSGLKIPKPDEFLVTGRNNTGRFGWLYYEGGLCESIQENGSVTGAATQDWRIRGGSPMVTDRRNSLSITPGTKESPQPGKVEQNWFAKTTKWKHINGEVITSTLSLGSPAILWEGSSLKIDINMPMITHLAFPAGKSMKVVGKGEKIEPNEIKENWFLAFSADPEVRDMPFLIVLTKKPGQISFNESLAMEFAAGGFGALFTQRLWGVKRLAAGETVAWTTTVPETAIADARRWSRINLSFPVNTDEIAWLEGETAVLVNRFEFKTFTTDWKTKPIQMSILPPVLFLAQNVGAPVELPAGLTDLNCFTKFGPVKAVKGNTSLIRIPLPPSDHRAIVPAEGRMIVQDAIDYRVTGLALNSGQYVDHNIRNEGGGNLNADLIPYDISRAVPWKEAPQIDLYKWWYTFNAIQVRQVYGEKTLEEIDRHHRLRYLETLNFYPHKSIVVQKREPFSRIEYPVTFVWPTQTQYGFRHFNDVNEASGHDAYCLASYAKYYGDWTTLRANWNILRYHHNPLPMIHDWACMSSGAHEYWTTSGLDMLNSEAYGSLAFAYTAEYAGSPKDVLTGKIMGARSMIPTVARLDLQDYIQRISDEGDVWREFQGFYHFNEHGFVLSRNKMGGVGMLDTSKGTFHELSLGYKMWAGKRTHEEQLALAGGMENPPSSASPDVTQRLILGWDINILSKAIENSSQQIDYQRVPRWQESTSLYDMAILCTGDIPVFLSDWTPAEYLAGNYNEQQKRMDLTFQSHLGEPFTVKIYSLFSPEKITLNGQALTTGWTYDNKTGWLKINLKGEDEKVLTISLGEKAAPLHPYFTKILNK